MPVLRETAPVPPGVRLVLLGQIVTIPGQVAEEGHLQVSVHRRDATLVSVDPPRQGPEEVEVLGEDRVHLNAGGCKEAGERVRDPYRISLVHELEPIYGGPGGDEKHPVSAPAHAGTEHQVGAVEVAGSEIRVPHGLAQPVVPHFDLGTMPDRNRRIPALAPGDPRERRPAGLELRLEAHSGLLRWGERADPGMPWVLPGDRIGGDEYYGARGYSCYVHEGAIERLPGRSARIVFEVTPRIG